LQQEADKNKTTLTKAKMANDAELQRTQLELQAKERLALVQQLGQLFAVDAKVDAENARSEIDAAIARVDKELDIRKQAVDHAHEQISQVRDHAHEAAITAVTQAHEANMQALQHDQALEQQQQQAALQPPQAQGQEGGA
jgi:hypothetical protein